MSKVFVLDSARKPSVPIYPGAARLLLTQGKAAVFRKLPFTIILKQDPPEQSFEPLRLKIDPGSKTTGLAIVQDTSGEVVWAGEVTHWGQGIKKRLDDRRAIRRNRRQRK